MGPAISKNPSAGRSRKGSAKVAGPGSGTAAGKAHGIRSEGLAKGRTKGPKQAPGKVVGRQPRRDILSGESTDRDSLVRFVIAPDGTVVPDLEGKLPGRGLWLSPNRDVLNSTRLTPLFSRAARGAVTVPADLADRLETLLAGRCRQLLGLARRAGQAVAGYEKVRAALRQGDAAVLVAARDGADSGREKLRALAPDLPLVDALDSVEIGAALGSEGATVHAALADGRLARDLLKTADKLAALRRGRSPQ